ncbi:MAG TPA: DUF1549 and DUF1553 domain-containing protein [Chthoniobacteraceae bacterium]|nr:DUF1549 and DUF1553 domain-containing protein [Chthoniobacteraceae bacterium]
MKIQLRTVLLVSFLALNAALIWHLSADNAAPATRVVEVFPPDINMQTKRASQALVVRETDPSGVTHDITATAKITTDPALAKISGNTITPVSDGKGTVKVVAGGSTIDIPIQTKDAAIDPPISFKRDIMPVFLKAGCNTGACHGSARGKDGFHLSLFGYDPDGDYFRITREVSGRRINLALPEESLLLQKATGNVAHTGGKRFDTASPLYKTLLRWIQEGAQADPPDVATVTGVDLLPKDMLLEGENTTQQMTVRAHYSDGSVRDVTPLAVFTSNNDASAKVDTAGLVTSGARGEAFIMARYATFTVGSGAIVIPKDLKFQFPQVAEVNYIDTAIDDKLRKLRIAPSGLCSDEEFVRRVYIDTIGLVPTVQEHDRFMASNDPDKRAKLIDELLARPEFADMWVMKMAEMLEIRSSDVDNVSYKATLLYFNWLRDRITANTPINEIVRQLVSASGGTFDNPIANYYQEEIDPLKLAENCAQSFLGIRVQCAQCHNHPFDRWTMNDYRGFVGFFTQVGRKKAEDPREIIVFNSGEGESRHPVTNDVVPPRFLGGIAPDTKGKDRRQVLADWLASPDNPWFAKHFANIIWAQYFGRGIIEPVDDVRVSNPSANPELLDALGKKFVEYNYDFRRLIRDICNSRTYQLSSVTNDTNEADVRNFSHSAIRRLRAEVMLDCISEVTDTRDKFKGLPLGARAVQIADGKESSYFLKTFGRATRDTVCTCDVVMEPNLSQALHLLNGDTVQTKITNGAIVKKGLDAGKSTRDIVDNLYVRCFGRPPTDQEWKSIEPMLEPPAEDNPAPAQNAAPAASGTVATQTKPAPVVATVAANTAAARQQRIEDLFWALLNSKEFMFNH